MRIEIDNQTDCPINQTLLEDILEKLTSKELELIIVDNAQIQELNKQYRNIDKPTDVLSFPLEDTPFMPLGTVVISSQYAQEKANVFKHTLEDEIALLFIHGILHCMGYDHEVDNGEQRDKEVEIIEYFNLPKSLIVRTQE